MGAVGADRASLGIFAGVTVHRTSKSRSRLARELLHVDSWLSAHFRRPADDDAAARIVAALPARHRAALLAHYVGGHESIAGRAAAAGLSIGEFRRNLDIARQTIRFGLAIIDERRESAGMSVSA